MSDGYLSLEVFQAESAALRTTIAAMRCSPDNIGNWNDVSEKVKSMVTHHAQNTAASQRHIKNIAGEFRDAYYRARSHN